MLINVIKDFKCLRELKLDGAVGCMLYLPPNKMWIGTDKIIVILDTNVRLFLFPLFSLISFFLYYFHY